MIEEIQEIDESELVGESDTDWEHLKELKEELNNSGKEEK